MTWLCSIKLASILVVAVLLVFVTAIVSYGMGARAMNRKYWKMLAKAGSRVTLD